MLTGDRQLSDALAEWSKALVRHGAEARLALAVVLGMPAGDIGARDHDG